MTVATIPFNIRNWYWIVGGDNSQAFSSAVKAFVPAANATYRAWLTSGGFPTRISTLNDLLDVLVAQVPDLVPADAPSQSRLKDAQASALDKTMLRIIFNHENRIRALEAKAPLSQAQFITAVRALI